MVSLLKNKTKLLTFLIFLNSFHRSIQTEVKITFFCEERLKTKSLNFKINYSA